MAKGHSKQQLRRNLLDALQSDQDRIGFLLGAGCPLGIYKEGLDESMKLIPDVATLTRDVESKLGKTNRKLWDRIAAGLRGALSPIEPHVEHILSDIRAACSVRSGVSVVPAHRVELISLDKEICGHISKIVSVDLPKHLTSYRKFAMWARNATRARGIEVFTPNYDLLLEQAFEFERTPFFDGFIGSHESFFDMGAVERGETPKGWVNLWKLHGSVNWYRHGGGDVVRVTRSHFIRF